MRRCSITSSFLFVLSPTRALYPLAFRRGHHSYLKNWLRRKDLNQRPLAYEASELPNCSTAQFWRGGTDSNRRLSFRAVPCCHGKTCSTETLCPAELPPRYFRLPFVKERWYYRIHHLESQGQKIHPAVCGRQGAPLWRNESGFLPITAKSVGVRCCVGLRRCLCWLDGSRHLAVTASLHDAEVGIGLGDLI